MVVVATTRYTVNGIARTAIQHEFNNVEDLRASIREITRGNLFQEFDEQMPVANSDPPIEFENSSGDQVEYSRLLQAMFREQDDVETQSGGTIPIIGERGSGALFSYQNVNRPVPRRRNRNRSIPFANNSNLIQKVREFLNDPNNREEIEKTLEPIECLGIHYNTYEEIVGFYNTITCVVFSCDLYYSGSKLIQLIHKKVTCCLNAIGTHDGTDTFGYSQPRKIHVANSAPYRIADCILKLIDCTSIDQNVYEEDFKKIADGLQIDIYLFDLNVYARAKAIFNTGLNPSVFNSSLYTNTEKLEEFKEDVKIHKPWTVYKGGDSIKRIRNRRFGSIIFECTNRWEESMHIDVECDAVMTYRFESTVSKGFYSTADYKGQTIMQKRSNSDIVKFPEYYKPFVPDYKKAVDKGVPLTHVINDSTSYLKLKNIFWDELHLFKDNANPEEKNHYDSDAYKRLRNNVPIRVEINPSFFNDTQDTRCAAIVQPFLQDGMFSLLDVFADFDSWMHSIGYRYSNSIPSRNPQAFRESFLSNIAKETPTALFRVVSNLQLFQFFIDPVVDFPTLNYPGFEITFFVTEQNDLDFATRIVKSTNSSIPLKDEWNKIANDAMKDLEKDHANGLNDFVYERKRLNITNRTGLAYAFSKTNVIWDLVQNGKGKGVDKATGASLCSVFQETLPVQLERLHAFKSNLLEPLASVSWSADRYEDERILTEVDFSKMYSHIVMGGGTSVWQTDYYKEKVQMGGMKNPYLDNIDGPLLSYSIDFGMVLIEGSRINWDVLTEMCPEYFNHTCSWYLHRNKVHFVDVYTLIHLCSLVGVMLTRHMMTDPTTNILAIFKKIQMQGFRIRYGLFDTIKEVRVAMHSAKEDHKDSYLQDDFSGVMEKFDDKRIQLKYNHLPIKKDMYITEAKIKDVHDVYYEKPEKKASRIFNRFAQASEVVRSLYNGDDSCLPCLKNSFNMMIGKLKYQRPGGISSMTISDFKRQDSSQERKIKRSRKEDSLIVFDGSGKTVANNSSFSVAHIPGSDRVIVSHDVVNIEVIRNSFAPFRRYIINTGATMMDRLNYRYKSKRQATDSILIADMYVVHAQRDIKKWMANGNDTHEIEAYVPGCMPTSSFTDIDMLSNPLAAKYELLLRPGEHHDKYQRQFEDLEKENPGEFTPLQAKEFRESDKGFDTIRDSDVFRQVVQEYIHEHNCPQICWGVHHNDMGAYMAIQGLELHNHLIKSIVADQRVKEIYKIHSERSAQRLLDMHGAVMIGDPGCGKTERLKIMRKLSKRKCYTIAAMHSIVQLSMNGPNDKQTMTAHKFFGCKIDVAAGAKDPEKMMSAQMKKNKSPVKMCDILICDEAETFSVEFEEYIKVCKESFGIDVYLVGDPLQAGPMFGLGLCMKGSVALYVSNRNRYIFDMQFRNINERYRESLDVAADGIITRYLHPSMGSYHGRADAIDVLDRQLEEAANEMIATNRVTRLFACSNYKVNLCIMTEVMRRVLVITNGDFAVGCDVILHTGRKEIPNANFLKTDEPTNPRWVLERDAKYLKMMDRNVKFGSYNGRVKGQNGPSAQNMLIGLPLIMKPLICFRVMNRFESSFKEHDYIAKSVLLMFTGNKTQHRFGTDKFIAPLDYYEFKTIGFNEYKWLSKFEIAMYMTYEFAIQREFIIGTTVDKLTIVQAVLPHTRSYESIQSTLARQEETYGSNSILTDLARIMRVAVTRVRDSTCSTTLDLHLMKHNHGSFWHSVLSKGPSLFVLPVALDQIKELSRRMRKQIIMAKDGKIRRASNSPSTKQHVNTDPPDSMFHLGHYITGELDPLIKKHSFPQSLVNLSI